MENEIGRAKNHARKHNVEAEKATSLLEETRAPAEVKAQVKTKTKVVESDQSEIETTQGRTSRPVRKTLVRGVDEGPDASPDASLE